MRVNQGGTAIVGARTSRGGRSHICELCEAHRVIEWDKTNRGSYPEAQTSYESVWTSTLVMDSDADPGPLGTYAYRPWRLKPKPRCGCQGDWTVTARMEKGRPVLRDGWGSPKLGVRPVGVVLTADQSYGQPRDHGRWWDGSSSFQLGRLV